jgi:uncharacterized damage-inducible protein DinB
MNYHPCNLLINLKRWADRGLYEEVSRNFACLSREDLSIMLRILDHMHAVDRIFQHHLQGLPHPFSAPRSDPIPDFDTLAASARETDDWYSMYVSNLAPGELEQPVDFVFTSGKPARLQRNQILLHVCLHGTYHRGNAGALLELRGIKPTARDSVTDFLEDEHYGECPATE